MAKEDAPMMASAGKCQLGINQMSFGVLEESMKDIVANGYGKYPIYLDKGDIVSSFAYIPDEKFVTNGYILLSSLMTEHESSVCSIQVLLEELEKLKIEEKRVVDRTPVFVNTLLRQMLRFIEVSDSLNRCLVRTESTWRYAP